MVPKEKLYTPSALPKLPIIDGTPAHLVKNLHSNSVDRGWTRDAVFFMCSRVMLTKPL